MAGALTAHTFVLYGIALVALGGLAWWAWLIWDSRCRHTRLRRTHGEARLSFDAMCLDCGRFLKTVPPGAKYDNGI